MRLYALTDFGIFADDGDEAIGGDADERSWSECGGRRLRGLRENFGEGVKMESEEDAASGDGGDTEKTAAIEKRGLHGTS
jgi:hypothetical protein